MGLLNARIEGPKIAPSFKRFTSPRRVRIIEIHRRGEGGRGVDFRQFKGAVMKEKQIIVGQKVNPIKQERAKQLRREMTPEEKKLWYYLRSNQLNGLHFRRQQVIDGFIADFYCHAARLVIEIDGGIHERQREYDGERDRIISSRGLQVIRIRNEEIQKDIYQVMQRIREVSEWAK